ncbi:MAG: DNA alkylation repair protein [Patescibacteria group bacterium]
MLKELKKELHQLKNPQKAKILRGFFKTGKGEYGEGDIFLGITVPQSRKIAQKYKNLSFPDIKKLLASKIHEERLIALLILVHNFTQGSQIERKKIYNFYLASTKRINNWDLVDLSAEKIVGAYIFDKPKNILKKLARSKNIWERRIAIVSTFYFIKHNRFGNTLSIARILLGDTHDLIHKATGWMLREVGKRSLATLEKFLNKYASTMPSTALRYAIERFSETKRNRYLSIKYLAASRSTLRVSDSMS